MSYSCRAGYTLTGSERRSCSDDGQWSGVLPVCRENLALLRPTTQSDVLWSYGPDLAVDGDPNTCSFTSRDQGQRWWQVVTHHNYSTPSDEAGCMMKVSGVVNLLLD